MIEPLGFKLDSTVNQGNTAVDFLAQAKQAMEERGKTYDTEGGERSMAATVSAFNAITGRDNSGSALTEADGWTLMALLKLVRQNANEGYHADSALDLVAYSALLAESLSNASDG